MEVYIEEPTDKQYELLSTLFEEWCKSGRSNLLHHMFEIIESHESPQVRDLVLEHMKQDYPDKDKKDIVELWITHPLPRMREFIADIVETKNFDEPIRAAAYVMLDDYQSLNNIDPDFHHLDNYLRNVDPLLGSLLIQKVEILKNPGIDDDFLQSSDDDEDYSLMDRIRKRDFTYIWENILDYPVPFVAEVLHIMVEEEWKPVDESGQELFDILIEQFGTSGWYDIENCKWVVMSKKVDGKFIPLTPVDISRGSFELIFSQDLIYRPDRISNQKFQSRGRFNLSDPQLGLNVYMEGIRRSEFDGLIHVPIYSNNGVELVEFTIPARSEKNFAMDEDGLYFTIKNKEGIYSVDLDALAAFLLPISRHSEMINQMIPILLERANEDQKMPIRAMNLLSTLHRGREFSLWDKKKQVSWDDIDQIEPKEGKCKCTIAIDFGNTTTKVAQVVKGECNHELQQWEFPTIIYYQSPSEFSIGQEVLDRQLEGTSQTFQNIKSSLKYGGRRHLRIQNTIITSYDAFKNYLFTVIDKVNEEVDFSIDSIAMTFPVHAPSGFEGWLRGILQSRGYSHIELTDELSASSIGSYRLHNQRGNVMVIDVGSSHMAAAIVDMNTNKTRKRLEEARMREDFEYHPEIVTKVSVDKGSLEIGELIFQAAKLDTSNFNEVQYDINTVKEILSSEFTADLQYEDQSISFSLGDKNGINLDQIFADSDLFYAFKILLRNVMVKANLRGISKKQIDTILILGRGSQWPGFLDYVNQIFSDKEIIIENDHFLTAKGVGLVANGQQLAIKLEQDVMLKVAKSGIVGYETVISRGESVLGKSKEFEVRPHSWMDKLVLDCWVRRPSFIADEEVQPLKDDQSLDHNKKTRELFSYDRVFRQIIDLDGDATLRVNTSSRGTLYFEVETGDKTVLVSTDTSIY